MDDFFSILGFFVGGLFWLAVLFATGIAINVYGYGLTVQSWPTLIFGSLFCVVWAALPNLFKGN